MISAIVPPVNDIIALLETQPLDPELWEQLAEHGRLHGDALGTNSLEVILTGLHALQKSAEEALAKGRPPVQTPLAAPLFSRLAKDYNEPRLLKEAGMLYLSVWRLPDIALQHFERCHRLGEPERNLRPLIEAATVAAQRLAAAKSGQKAAYSGIKTTEQASPVVVDMMRKTGLLMPSRVRPPAAAPAPVKKEEPGAVEPLPSSGPECLQLAGPAIAAGKLKRAQELLLRVGESPRDGREVGQAWAALAKANYEAGLFPEMEIAYQEASKFEPETMACHFNLALAKHLNRKFEQAEALYLLADSLEPNHPKVWCNLGSLYFQTGRYADSEKALRRCLRADGDYARAWDNLASALGAQNKLNDSLDACRHAIELRPGYPEAYFKMGVIYFGKNSPGEAAEAFRHACALPQLAPYAYAFLATIHARLEQTGPASAAIQKVLELEPKCELLWMAWNELGKAHYALGAYRPAAVAFQEATVLKPDEAEGWLNLALAHHRGGAREQAREFYGRALKCDEKSHLCWHNLGIVCAELNLHREATNAFQRELEIKPDNARAWYDLGVSLEAEGRVEEAAAALQKAESLEPPPAANAA